MTDPNETENLTGAYALDALSAQERAAVEAEAERSEALRSELTELSDTAVLLGLAVEPVQPRPELKADLLAKIASTPQLAPIADTTDEGDAVRPDPSSVRPAEARARARWFTRPVTLLAAAAAAVALFAGGAFAISQITRDPVSQIAAAEDAQQATAEVAGGGTATLVWSGELGASAVRVEDIAPLPDDRVYQLWYIDTSGATPAGTFTVGDGGQSWHVLEGTMDAGDTVGITVEPAGGSQSPTTDPVVAITTA